MENWTLLIAALEFLHGLSKCVFTFGANSRNRCSRLSERFRARNRGPKSGLRHFAADNSGDGKDSNYNGTTGSGGHTSIRQDWDE
jgi:hypothetical protein